MIESVTHAPSVARACQENPHNPRKQVAFPPPSDAEAPANTPPLNNSEMLEKVSLEELNVKPPDTLPETPVRFTLLKLSLLEFANADNDTASRNTALTLANFKDCIITLLQPYKSTLAGSLYLSLNLSRLIILATSCKRLQHLP